MRTRLTQLSLLAMAAAMASPAFAQQGDAPVAGSTQAVRTTSYDAAFFAPSAPRTALDIARLVPGFVLDLGNLDTRGFAGAAGNVVINGVRPSSKAETIQTTLSRIPARSVVLPLKNSMSLGTSKIMSSVEASCMIWPLSVVRIASALGLAISSRVTRHGPSGANVSNVFPRQNCPLPHSCCQSRALTSFEQV